MYSSSQIEENKALDDFKQALLAVNGSYCRSGGIDVDKIVIMLPREDWNYFKLVIENNPNGKAYKHYSLSGCQENEFRLSGILVRSYGI